MGTFFGVFGLFMLAMMVIPIMKLTKNTHTASYEGFSQAGVRVSYADQSIDIKGYSYPATAVSGLSWESGLGPRGNISRAKITVRDMNKPVHKIEFITPNAAQVFVERLAMAVQQAGGASFD